MAVVGAPGWKVGVKSVRSDHGREQGMTMIQPCIQQADGRRILGWRDKSSRRIIHELTLNFGCQVIELRHADSRCSQLAQTIEQLDRALELLPRCMKQVDRGLGQVERTADQTNSRSLGGGTKPRQDRSAFFLGFTGA